MLRWVLVKACTAIECFGSRCLNVIETNERSVCSLGFLLGVLSCRCLATTTYRGEVLVLSVCERQPALM